MPAPEEGGQLSREPCRFLGPQRGTLKIAQTMAVLRGMPSSPSTSGLVAAALFALVAISGLARPATAEAQNDAFNDTETRRLQRGQLVTRVREERRGDLLLIGGTSFQVLNAPADTVWRAIRDTQAYRHYLPQVDRVRSLGTSGETETVRISHRQGPLEAAYHLRVTFSDNLKTAQFRVDPRRANDVREGWGYLRVQPYGANRSMVTWAILADVGSGIAIGLMRSEIREWILQVPRLMRDYLGWARPRYEQ